MDDFQFLRPWWLLALPLGWLLLAWYRRHGRRGGGWTQVCDAALVPYVLDQAPARRGPGGLLPAVVLALTVLALAGPVWERVPVPVFRNESALVIALDLSTSMNAADLAPSRLARARFEVADLLDLRQDGQTALLVYAAQAFVVTPLTDDGATIAAQLPALDTALMPVQGSEPDVALRQAADLLTQAGLTRGHVLLLTDGADGAALARARATAEEADFHLVVLGLGTAEGAPVPDPGGGFLKDERGNMVLSSLDGRGLATLAAAGRGIYVEQRADDGDARRILEFITADRARAAERADALRSSQWQEAGPWLLLPVLPLAALAFRRGLLLVLLAAGVAASVPGTAQAGWWQTPAQAAERRFKEGDYDAAARQFADPAWRGAAHYRAGDYADAVADFAAVDSADGHYNRGNALARLGRYEEAIAAYASALERAPAHAAASHNKALLEKLLAERPRQPPSGGEGEGKDPGERDQPEGDQGGDDSGENSMSGGQEAMEDATTLSGGNASGGGGGEQQQPSEATDAVGQGAAQRADERRADDPAPRPESDGDAPPVVVAEQAADAEAAQATEQWLRQIPDDPAGLLRRKFQYQYKQLYGNRSYEGNRW